VPRVSVTIITLNEAEHIADAIDSAAWADEVIVVDSGSTDETVAIAERKGARVSTRPWNGYVDQKNHAATLAANDWILSLDADERVTPALAEEIRALLSRGPDARGYRISRVTWYLGRWIRGTDWFPDFQLRLYDRRAGRWSERSVHESFELNERPRKLRGELEHYAYRDINHHLSKINQYTTMAAQDWVAHGRRTNALELLIHPPVAFLRNYVLRAGFRAGAAGLVISIINSYYVFLKLAKLWEMQQQPSVDRRQSAVVSHQSPVASAPSRRAEGESEPRIADRGSRTPDPGART
jgi:glycosyltransferase involved in cell wall biosynthesis